MRPAPTLLPVLGLALVACDLPAPEACETPAFRAVSGLPTGKRGHNGLELQGIELNGTNFQGVRLNGINVQGTELDGLASARLDERGRLVGVTANEGPMRGEALVGATLSARTRDGSVVALELTHVDGHAVRLALDGVDLCAPGENGMFLPGVWSDDGARSDTVSDAPDFDVTFACDRGVLAKCVHWGYAPWDVGADVHQACTRMARADYCGDGTPYTKDGTAIDIGDALGGQRPSGDDAFEFEAGWGPDGAVCVSKPRYHESVVGLGDTLPRCWADTPTCDDEDEARAAGATLTNRSAPQRRLLCTPR